MLGARADCGAVTTCTVAWELARQPVRVFAGPSPSDIDHSRPLAVVRGALEVTVPVPDPQRSTYFEVVARRAKHGPIVTDRNLRLAGAPNTQDLGGYRTYDAKRVRFGRIFRSDGLDGLTEADRIRLESLGLPVTCSAPAAEATNTDLLDDAAIRATAAAVTTRAALEQYGALLRALARDNLPQFVQCTLVGDRMGWGAALILTTLGVPRETIVADYLQSTTLGVVPPPQRAYLDAGFEAVRNRYGKFGTYLVKGLGVNERTYRLLRKRLLA